MNCDFILYKDLIVIFHFDHNQILKDGIHCIERLLNKKWRNISHGLSIKKWTITRKISKKLVIQFIF